MSLWLHIKMSVIRLVIQVQLVKHIKRLNVVMEMICGCCEKGQVWSVGVECGVLVWMWSVGVECWCGVLVWSVDVEC